MPKTPPPELVDLVRKGYPLAWLRHRIARYVERAAARREAVGHAAALVDAFDSTPGAPKVKLWLPPKDGFTPRVYFAGKLGYVSVDSAGTIEGLSSTPGVRSSITFDPGALYPSQRRAYGAAMKTYYAEWRERRDADEEQRIAEIDELVAALGLADEDVVDEDEDLERQAGRAAWQARHEEGRSNPRGRRAKSGGEVGMNAEFYPGGTFLPSTRLPKGERPRYSSGSGRSLVAPGQLEVAPEPGLVAIFQSVRAIIRQRPDGTIEPLPRSHPYWEHSGADYDRAAALCERWNAGERWYDPKAE